MMKKRDLERRLRIMAASKGESVRLLKQGAKHEKWTCAGHIFMMPRHREIAERTALNIIKEVSAHLERNNRE